MKLKSLRVLLASLVVTLAACGGGGGGDSSPPPPPVNAAPTANAGTGKTVLAGARISLDGSASADPEGTALTYSWAFTTKPANSSATLTDASQAKPSFTADVAGDYVVSLTVNDGKLASAPSTVTIKALATDALTIVTEPAEPLDGNVKLSLSGSAAGTPVSWSVDSVQVGTGEALVWNSAPAGNGTHALQARLQITADKQVDIRRTVTVSHPNVPPSSIQIGSVSTGTTGTIYVDLEVSSPFGISSVSLSFQGKSLGTLNSPNYCSGACNGNNRYRFAFDTTNIVSGRYDLLATAVEGSTGATRQSAVAVNVSNAPVIQLNNPVDGVMVNGTLQLSGSVTSDKPGPVTIQAQLSNAAGNLALLNTTSSPFNVNFNLTGVAAGTYAMFLTATDSGGATTTIRRAVMVASDPSLVYTPVATLGFNAQMLAADADLLVYKAPDYGIRLRNTATGAEVVLASAVAGTNQPAVGGWLIMGGRVYASGKLSDCATASCVYEWQSTGERKNVSNANPYGANAAQSTLAVCEGTVAWTTDDSTHELMGVTLYTPATQTYAYAPAEWAWTSFFALNAGSCFKAPNGVVNLLFSVYYGHGNSSTYRWTSDTAKTVLFTDKGAGVDAPGLQTDGARVAWPDTRLTFGKVALRAQPVNGTLSTVLATDIANFFLRDGVLAWLEVQSGTGQKLQASTSSGTTVVSSTAPGALPSVLYGTSGGIVVYGELGKIRSWNSADAKSTLRLDGPPAESILLTGKVMYFVLGADNRLYKVPLN